ncbi:MAG: hypothetical protein AB7F86_09435 [Bdellovibrionales bacterium]
MTPLRVRQWLTLSLSMVMATPSFGASRDQIVRTDKSPLTISTDLQKDIYRTETYQDTYTEQVPYQDEETYYERVPYQEQETYTDYEDYWVTERICRDETRYEEQCRDERVCTPRFERRCERRRVCQVVLPGALQALYLLFQMDAAEARGGDRGGGGGRGPGNGGDHDRERREREDRDRQERERRDREGREREERDRREREGRDRQDRERRDREERERHDRERREREERDRREREDRERRERECWREVCDNVKVGEDCRTERQCHRIPKTDRVCKDEQVRKSRPVTKTRWVTKYREERRTRWVTKYRTEQRCCVTKEREVFDHRIQAHVDLNFPAQATLVAGEQEKFRVKLREVAGRSEVTIEAEDTLYTYNPVIQKVNEEQFSVDMQVVPTYDPRQLGPETISDVKLTSLGRGVRLSLTDKGIVRKLQSDYQIQLVDATGQQLAQLPIMAQTKTNFAMDLDVTLPVGTDVVVKLAVQRNGIVVSAPVRFSQDYSVKVAPEDKYDTRPYMDKTQVGKFSVDGRKETTILYFRDLTKDIPQVVTEYHYRLSVGSKVLAEKAFLRSDLSVNPDGKIPLPLSEAFDVSPADLEILKSGATLRVEGEVVRIGSRFPDGRFAISKRVSLEID